MWFPSFENLKLSLFIPDAWTFHTDFYGWTGINLHTFIEVILIILTCLILSAASIMDYIYGNHSSTPSIFPGSITSTGKVGGGRKKK